MNVQQVNLLFALNIAIKDQERVEKDMNYTRDSALLAGFRQLYDHIRAGGAINIIPSEV